MHHVLSILLTCPFSLSSCQKKWWIRYPYLMDKLMPHHQTVKNSFGCILYLTWSELSVCTDFNSSALSSNQDSYLWVFSRMGITQENILVLSKNNMRFYFMFCWEIYLVVASEELKLASSKSERWRFVEFTNKN